MKNNKNGISLIVLVITIIVMIILAATAIISLTDTNLIDRAGEANDEFELKQVQNLAALAWSDAYTAKMTDPTVDIEEAVRLTLEQQGVVIDKYHIEISNTGVVVNLKSMMPGANISGYKIYGNSIQTESKNLFDKATVISGFVPQSGSYPTNDSQYPDASYQIIELVAGEKINIIYTGERAADGRIRYIDSTTNMVVGPLTKGETSYYSADASYNNGFVNGSITAKKDFKIAVLYIKSMPNDFNLQIKSVIPTTNSPIEIKSVGDKTKNLVDIPEITSATRDVVVECNITKNIIVSCQSYPTSIKNDNNEETSIWRIRFDYLDGTQKWVVDASLKSGEVYGLRLNATETNPIVSYTYRGTYIKEGSYKGIQVEYGSTSTEYEPYGYRVQLITSNGRSRETANIYLKEPLRKIGEYADYIDIDNKKVVRAIASEYVDAVEHLSTESTNYYRFLTDIEHTPLLIETEPNSNYATTKAGLAISNKFSMSSYSYNELGKHSNIIQSYITTQGVNRIAYTFSDSNINTIGQAQSKIGNGFEVCYVMSESIEETIEIPNIPALKGTITLSVNTEISPSKIDKTN